MIAETLLFVLHSLSFNWPLKFSSTRSPQSDDKPSNEESEKPSMERPKPNYRYHKLRLGVWEVVYRTTPGISELGLFRSAFLTNARFFGDQWPLIIRFMKESYTLAPFQVGCYLTHNLWESLQGSLSMYFTSKLLDLIGDRLQGKGINQITIMKFIALRIFVSLLSSILLHFFGHDIDILKNRINYAYFERAMRAALKVELPMAEDPEVVRRLSLMTSIKFSGREAWEAFESFCGAAFAITRVGSQLLMTLALVQKSPLGLTFVAMCLIKPLINLFLSETDFLSSNYVSYCVEPAYARMAQMFDLAFRKGYREDRLSDGADEFIEKEFMRNREIVGDMNTQHVYAQLQSASSVRACLLEDVVGNLSLYIFSISLIFIEDMTFTSLTLYEQISWTISSTFDIVRRELDSFLKSLATVKDMYDLDKLRTKFKDGTVEYPLKVNAIENSHRGAHIEFRNVCFAYPNSSKNVLNDVSFTIQPGQMVVIVGVNGSGKSSTVKLFNRLYEPTSGTILLDGRPLSEYKVADIRRSMAILRQNHSPYPISLRENIALGLPGRDVTEREVEEAARQGGAAQFIEKLDEKYETVLEPVSLADFYCVDWDGDDKMMEYYTDAEHWTNISGGESQRLSASRMFLRLAGGETRFLVADEPTSALDPEGEYDLFSRLREMRGTKTLVFITHRFGHLTKYADLILCMKDGMLVEQGTHDELIAKRGEYFTLHDVQARAFV